MPVWIVLGMLSTFPLEHQVLNVYNVADRRFTKGFSNLRLLHLQLVVHWIMMLDLLAYSRRRLLLPQYVVQGS